MIKIEYVNLNLSKNKKQERDTKLWVRGVDVDMGGDGGESKYEQNRFKKPPKINVSFFLRSTVENLKKREGYNHGCPLLSPVCVCIFTLLLCNMLFLSVSLLTVRCSGWNPLKGHCINH